MQGRIVNFRGNIRMQKYNKLLILVDGVDSKDKAQTLVGKAVVWKTPAGKEMKGKVTNSHGDAGTVRVLFESGMPGQCLGTKVDLQ